MYSPSGHPRSKWFYFFIRTDLEKLTITSLAHQWILCSEWVPSEWESKQQQHHNNPQHDSSPSVHFLLREKLHVAYVIKKSVKMLLPWKSPSLLSSRIQIHPHICLELFWTVLFNIWNVFDCYIHLYSMAIFLTNMQDDHELDSCCGLLRCVYQLGLPFWRHPFNPEDTLQSKRYNAEFL